MASSPFAGRPRRPPGVPPLAGGAGGARRGPGLSRPPRPGRRGAGSPACWPALAGRLDALLPRCPDAGMALTNLERFVSAGARPRGDRPGDRRQRPDRRGPRPTVQHEPALQRADDPRPVAARLAPRRRRAARPRDAHRRALGRAAQSRPTRRPSGSSCGGSDGARRCGSATTTSSRAHPAGGGHARPVAPGRRLRRGRLPPGPPPRRGEARHPLRTRRTACAVRRPGAGQARRRGAELQLRHRPDLPLRRRGADRRAPGRLERRVLRPDGGRGRPPAVRPHGARGGVPGRHAAPARGGPGGPGPLAGGDSRLLRDLGPHLGAPGADQVPPDRRRPRPRPCLPRRDRPVRLPHATWAPRRSARSRR